TDRERARGRARDQPPRKLGTDTAHACAPLLCWSTAIRRKRRLGSASAQRFARHGEVFLVPTRALAPCAFVQTGRAERVRVLAVLVLRIGGKELAHALLRLGLQLEPESFVD